MIRLDEEQLVFVREVVGEWVVREGIMNNWRHSKNPEEYPDIDILMEKLNSENKKYDRR